jgi:hypothetical protein
MTILAPLKDLYGVRIALVPKMGPELKEFVLDHAALVTERILK